MHMATTPSLQAPGIPVPQEPAAESIPETVAEQALVTTTSTQEVDEPAALGGAVARLPVEVDVAIPVRDFRVRNLLALQPGEFIESQWCSGDDLPLATGEVQLAWSEFEVLDAELAVRITRLA